MPRYEFQCSSCDAVDEFFKPIAEGPPKHVDCSECDGSMYHVMGCNFVLKGNDWAGKQVGHRQEDYELAKAREETDVQLAEDSRNQQIVEEVVDVRRKGRKAADQFKRNRPQKWDDYEGAMKKGYRPKKKKSYEMKAMKGVNLGE